MKGLRKVKACLYCSVCSEKLDNLDTTMWVWGYDLDENPLILVHQSCDPNEEWIFSTEFNDSWRCLNRKCWGGKQFPIRYRIHNEYPSVKPIRVDSEHISIKCPYCKEIHIHGSNGGRNYEGYRLSHCENKDNPGYNILTKTNDENN